MNEYYHLTVEEVLASVSSERKGLSGAEAESRLAKFNLNELKREKQYTAFKILLDQLKNFLVLLLIFAAAVAFFLGDALEAFAMVAIIILTVLLGFFQEYRAEKAIEALEKISSPTARAMRDGIEVKIPASKLVPGDIILIEEGDIIPADARLIEVEEMSVDQASLTGESMPSKKTTSHHAPGTPLADQKNMVFMSTIVTYGKGKAVITATGMNTEIGAIASSLQETQEVQTPLQKKFEHMSQQLGIAVLILVSIVFIAGLLKTDVSLREMFFFALSLAVAAVPSSLAAIVTISLALGARTLATKNMIIKKLPAAESLGAVTIICSDKTGTLTKNQMTVTKLYVHGVHDEIIDISGAGYQPQGVFAKKGRSLSVHELASIELPLRIGSLCNNAKLHNSEKGWEVLGDPTEGSLVVLGKKAGLHEDHLLQEHSFVYELPFDSERKRMSVIFDERRTGKRYVYVKGAPDQLLEQCTRSLLPSGKITKLTSKDKSKILGINNDFASQALRVLGLAYAEIPAKQSNKAKQRSRSKDLPESEYTIEHIENNLIFVGLVGMIDPPREEVAAAVEQCKRAGIKVMVITGDQAITAEAVARKIGLFKDGDLILTGTELSALSDEELIRNIDSLRIVARALPIQKSRIVDMLQKRGHTVAMTGDGVNDAPALKKADIGVAMGITGTDVAKEVSKAILVDDNFASIVNAVAEGRNIYDKIVKSTRYLLSCNMGEITSVFVALLLNFPLPMVPLQILLMNLVTDGLPALGLGMESPDDDVMSRPPRSPKENPLSGQTFFVVVLFGLIMGLGSMYLFSQYYLNDLVHARTMAFTSLVMFEMFAVLNNRSLQPFRKLNIFTNHWLFLGVASSILIQIAVIYFAPLQGVFGTVALTLSDWYWIIGTSAVGFLVMECSKLLFRRMVIVPAPQM